MFGLSYVSSSEIVFKISKALESFRSKIIILERGEDCLEEASTTLMDVIALSAYYLAISLKERFPQDEELSMAQMIVLSAFLGFLEGKIRGDYLRGIVA